MNFYKRYHAAHLGQVLTDACQVATIAREYGYVIRDSRAKTAPMGTARVLLATAERLNGTLIDYFAELAGSDEDYFRRQWKKTKS